jgi:hypothetical protein
VIDPYDEKTLGEEVRNSEQMRDRHLGSYEEQISNYASARYEQGDTNIRRAANHGFEYATLMVPGMVFNNPRFTVKTELDSARPQAAALQRFLNRWSELVCLGRALATPAVEMLFAWSVVHVRHQSRDDMRTIEGKPAWIPGIERVPPRRWLIDPYCDGVHNCEYAGHLFIESKDRLVDQAERERADGDDSWIMSAVRQAGTQKGGDKPSRREIRGIDRDEIVGFDIWFPRDTYDDDMTPDLGFHGTRAMYAWIGGELAMIREPRPFYGPSTGPYAVAGAYSVPDRPFPLAPMVPAAQYEDRLDGAMNAADRGMNNYKRVVAYQADGQDEAIKVAPNQYWVPIENMEDARPQEIEVGGITDQHLRMIEYSQTMLERLTGIDMAQRGAVTGVGTATENVIAQSATEKRSAYVTKGFRDMVAAVGKIVAWYAHHDGDTQAPIGSEPGGGTVWYVGGENDVNFIDLELSIEPKSMERSTDPIQQQRTARAFEAMAAYGPLIPQAPWLPWRDMFNRLGDSVDFPGLGDSINMELAMAMGGQQAEEARVPEPAKISREPQSSGAGNTLDGAMQGLLGGAAAGMMSGAAMQ